MIEQISRDYGGNDDDDAQNLKRASADSRQQTTADKANVFWLLLLLSR